MHYKCFIPRIATLLTGMSLIIGAFAQQPSNPPVPRIKETVVAEISGRGRVLDAWISPQFDVVWAEVYPNHTTAVLFNGKVMGDYYDDLKYVDRSPDGRHWAFTARRGKSGWILVIDGKERTTEYEALLSPAITDDGHFLIPARKAGKWRLVADGQETGPEFEDLRRASFDSTGNHYFCTAKRRGKWITFRDGKELGVEIDEVSSLRSWHSGRIFILGKINGKYTWIVDGQPGPGFDVLTPLNFFSSNAAQHYAYAGANGTSGQPVSGSIVVDGKIVATHQGAQLRGGWLAAQELRPGVASFEPSVYGVSDPAVFEDGSVVYAARRGEKDVAVISNGVAGPAFEDVVSPIVASTDGKHVAYVGKRGESFIEVLDQKPGTSFPAKAKLSLVPWISLNNDGSRLAYEIVRGGRTFRAGVGDLAWRRVVVDGKGPEYHALAVMAFEFSDDGKHFHYQYEAGLPDHHQNWIVFDGVEGPPYDLIYYDLTRFIDSQTIEYIARRGNKFIRVTEKLN